LPFSDICHVRSLKKVLLIGAEFRQTRKIKKKKVKDGVKE